MSGQTAVEGHMNMKIVDEGVVAEEGYTVAVGEVAYVSERKEAGAAAAAAVGTIENCEGDHGQIPELGNQEPDLAEQTRVSAAAAEEWEGSEYSNSALVASRTTL